jgi:hypothetical protein
MRDLTRDAALCTVGLSHALKQHDQYFPPIGKGDLTGILSHRLISHLYPLLFILLVDFLS